jgi:nucleoid-associated protein YgaU
MRAIRFLGRGVRALLCALALLGLTVGTPLVLLAIGTALGEYIPGRDEVSLDLLLRPDDGGGVAYAVLLAAGWVCWGMVVASVALEVPAALRGRTRRRRVRGLGWSQHMVAVLLSGIALTASVGAAGAVSASATTPGISVPVQTGDPAQQPTRAVQPAPHTGPTHTVSAGETLWSIAEEYLGDGTQWARLAELNDGRRMPDGQVFDADRTIRAGWQLRLPADAQIPVPEAGTRRVDAPVVSAAHGLPNAQTVTVVSGDTLSAIAERELGDADRYPEIVQASQHLVQPDGLKLTDADEIRPGWRLNLPADTPVAAEPPAEVEPPVQSAPAADAPAEPSAPAQDPTPPPADTTPSPEPSTATSPPAPSAPAVVAPGHGAGTSGTSVLLPATLGLGALTGAGLLAAIAVRRRHQHRQRHADHRIALPKPPASAYEQQLRSSETPEDSAILDRALRTLAAELANVGRPMPSFTTALVSDDGIELRMSAPEPAVAPFANADAAGHRWTCPLDATLLPIADAGALPAPCPALAPIAEGAMGKVLLDLESAGVTPLGQGTEGDHVEILRALAVSLLTSAWGEDQSITLVGLHDIEGFEPQYNPQLNQATLPDAIRTLETWQRACAPVLAGEGLNSARSGRTLYAAPDTWPPSIVLSVEPLDADAVAALSRLEAERPRAAWAVVAPVVDGLDLPTHWQPLPTTEGPTELGGIDGQVTIHRMADSTHAALLQILATAAAPDEPVPQEEPADEDGAPESLPATNPSPSAGDGPDTVHPSITTPPVASPRSDPLPVVEATSPGPTSAPQAVSSEDAGSDRSGRHGPAVVSKVVAGSNSAPTAPDQPREARGGDASTPSFASEESADGAGPRILVLGPVEISNVGQPAETSKRARLTEFAAFLVLNPGLGHADVDAALWRDGSSPANRHTATSKLRRWLGTDTNGDPYLPMIGEAGYRLGAAVTCDWHQFQRLSRRGTRLGPDGISELTEALALVRGKPFGGTHPRRYIWAEYLRQEMIWSIVDVAARLGELHLAQGDVQLAKLALGRGLEVCPESEMLYRLMFRAAHISGGPAEVDAYVSRLTDVLDAMGCDMEEDTIEVLRQLQGR